MGFFNDAFKGYDKCKLKSKMTVNELFKQIEDVEFPAGKPKLKKAVIGSAIYFPPVDKYQVYLTVSGKTITAVKSYSSASGLGKEAIGDALTGGWYQTLNRENNETNAMTRTIIEIVSEYLDKKELLAKK